MGAVEDARAWFRSLPPHRQIGVHRYIAGLNRDGTKKHRGRAVAPHYPAPAEQLPGQLTIDDMKGK